MITGAKAMVKGLKEQGVDIMFGYPGATICPFYDELAKDGDVSVIFWSDRSRTPAIWHPATPASRERSESVS